MKHEASISCYRIPKGNSLITKIFLSAFQEVNHETEIRRASNAGSCKNCIYQFLCHVWSLRSLFESTVFSALFTVFYVFAIRRKAGPEAKISTAALLFFTGITVLCFFTLRLMNFMTERKHRQQEQKYLDEE